MTPPFVKRTTEKFSKICFAVSLACAVGVLTIVASAHAQDPPLPTVFQSSNNDVIRIHQNRLPDVRMKTSRSSQRLVTVCLRNAPDSSGVKAYDVQKEKPPRYRVNPGHEVCSILEPTRHILYFWKTASLDHLKLVLSHRLDLRAETISNITLEWILD